ncbi:hypothetical protein C8T65DRAFT_709710 [Cerioporus squamosus]|nr:hypothetical protein C8T65DRAFT_709710 [Cerioporus squamosus]
MRRDPQEIVADRAAEVVTIMGNADDTDGGQWEDERPAPDAAQISNEEAVASALRELLDARLGYRKYKDTRTWRQRIENMDARWQALMPSMLTAYLQWKYGHCEQSESPEEPSEYDLHVEPVDYFNPRESAIIRRSSSQNPAEALVLKGYLGSVPDHPSIVISLDTLELFYDIRRFKPSFSVEAFTKMVCYKYVIPYRRRYRKAISDAFDVYLTLMESVHVKVQAALGRGTRNWRPRYACPACSYKTAEEPSSLYERMYVMDGNNSLKRVAPFGNRKVGDTRTFASDYFIPPHVVDKFANEVKPRQSQPHVEVPDSVDQDPDSDLEEPTEGDPTDGAPVSACASNWKAAASDEKKRMWAIFEETGVFAAACRHGFVLWLIDQIRSGELAKYPLAMTDAIITEIAEAIILAFDIGCSFKVTLMNSSLGQAFQALGSRMTVNAFHGYSHSYPCQLRNHPNIVRGMGIEDLETMERVFSASNQLASVIRYASAYRRHLLIHMFFRQWDEEKYANLGAFMYNNYVQALDIIKSKKPVLEESMGLLKLSHEELDRLAKEEASYFETLRDESPWDVHAIAYVEALQELRAANSELGNADHAFLMSIPENYQWRAPQSGPTDYYRETSATRKLETRRRELEDKVRRLTSQVISYELVLHVNRRWQPGDREYEETTKYIATRNYQRALGRLQRLVIQRLFELHKLNVSQTAYRMQTHIAKSLQKRCKAIRTAVKQYNAAAAALTPPRPELNWDAVSHFSFLEEFSLLQDTRNDIRSKAWAQPLVRETMRTANRVTRAEEELVNVSREALRVHTSIRDEDILFSDVLSKLKSSDALLYGAVNDWCRRRRAVNAHLLAHLLRLYALEGYTGIRGPGTHVGPAREQFPMPDDITPVPPSATTLEHLAVAESSALELDEHEEPVGVEEDADGAVTDLMEHIANIAVVM